MVVHDGKYPQCASGDTHLMRFQKSKVSYDSDVRVDGMRWKTPKPCGEDCRAVAAEHPDPPQGASITVAFWREKSRVRGMLMFQRIDADNKITCATALSIRGTYSP